MCTAEEGYSALVSNNFYLRVFFTRAFMQVEDNSPIRAKLTVGPKMYQTHTKCRVADIPPAYHSFLTTSGSANDSDM